MTLDHAVRVRFYRSVDMVFDILFLVCQGTQIFIYILLECRFVFQSSLHTLWIFFYTFERTKLFHIITKKKTIIHSLFISKTHKLTLTR